jgi:hypothetical protein
MSGVLKLCATLPSAPDEPLADKAKKHRFNLICEVGVHDLAADAAESVHVGNSTELMLTHQMAGRTKWRCT